MVRSYAEGITHLNRRTLRNQTGTDLETSSLLAFMVLESATQVDVRLANPACHTTNLLGNVCLLGQ